MCPKPVGDLKGGGGIKAPPSLIYFTQALIVVLRTRARMSPHVFKMNVGRMKGEAPKQIPLDPFFGTSVYLFLCIINKGPSII